MEGVSALEIRCRLEFYYFPLRADCPDRMISSRSSARCMTLWGNSRCSGTLVKKGRVYNVKPGYPVKLFLAVSATEHPSTLREPVEVFALCLLLAEIKHNR